MKVYLDTCCLNRPFDDQTLDRVRLEAEAIILILGRIEAGTWEWVGSEVLEFEIDQSPMLDTRMRIKTMLLDVSHRVVVGPREESRGIQLEGLGFHRFDALHLACAESGDADVFLTTDERLLRRAAPLQRQIGVKVANPLVWLQKWEEK